MNQSDFDKIRTIVKEELKLFFGTSSSFESQGKVSMKIDEKIKLYDSGENIVYLDDIKNVDTGSLMYYSLSRIKDLVCKNTFPANTYEWILFELLTRITEYFGEDDTWPTVSGDIVKIPFVDFLSFMSSIEKESDVLPDDFKDMVASFVCSWIKYEQYEENGETGFIFDASKIINFSNELPTVKLSKKDKDYINSIITTNENDTSKLSDPEYACWSIFADYPPGSEITEKEYEAEVKTISEESGLSCVDIYSLFSFCKREGHYLVSPRQVNITSLNTLNKRCLK